MPQPIYKPAGIQYMSFPDRVPHAVGGNPYNEDRWALIRQNRPLLEPDVGFYNPSDPAVMTKMIRQMKGAGADYVYFDIWPAADGKSFLGDHALKVFLDAPNPDGLKFCLGVDTTNAEFKNAPITMDTWYNLSALIGDMLDHSLAYRYAGMPMLDWLKFDDLVLTVARKLGSSINVLMDEFRKRSRLDTYVTASTDMDKHWMWVGKTSGCQGHSFYNMFRRTYLDKPAVLATATTAAVPAYVAPMPRTLDEQFENYMATYAFAESVLRTDSGYTDGKYDLWPTISTGWVADLLSGGSNIGDANYAQWEAMCKRFSTFVQGCPFVKGTRTNAWNEYYEGGRLQPTKAEGRTRLNTWSRYVGNT